MKISINYFLPWIISVSLIWSSPGFAVDNPRDEVLDKVMASSFATIYTNSYRDGIKAYNNERANPGAILLKLNPEAGDFLKGLLEKEKLKELPEWIDRKSVV